jgi:uncharacterized protein YegL
MIDEGFMGEGYVRRLPVYLLLDCSSSMVGAPIQAVNEGLGLIYRLLMADPQAVETVYISLICFSSQVDQYRLVPIDQFQPPTLTANGSTAMGEAFRTLVRSIEQDLVPNTSTQHGDYRPLAFLLTDGEPTDEYKSAIQELHGLRGSRRPTIVALGCGSGANTTMLHEVTENVFLMSTVSSETIKAFFRWISGSILQTSRSVGSSASQMVTMPPPTTIPGINYSPS